MKLTFQTTMSLENHVCFPQEVKKLYPLQIITQILFIMTGTLPLGKISLLFTVIFLRCLTFSDYPSTCMNISGCSSFFLNSISKGPGPCPIRYPLLVILSRAKFISLENPMNSRFPSSYSCYSLITSIEWWLFFFVSHTFLNPAI